eukprot:141222-Chlamydomonas_euryale.AAC.1
MYLCVSFCGVVARLAVGLVLEGADVGRRGPAENLVQLSCGRARSKGQRVNERRVMAAAMRAAGLRAPRPLCRSRSGEAV